MKIVIATAVYYPMINGVAVFSHNLAVGLARRGHEVMVICPSQTGKSSVEETDGVQVARLKSVEAKVYPDQIHEVPAKKKLWGKELPRVFYEYGFRVSVFPAREIKKLLNKFQPDVVHIQVSDPIGLSVAGYARRHGIPVVTTEHNQPDVFTEPLGVPKFVKKPVDALLSAYFVNRQSKSDFVTMPTELAMRKLIGEKEVKFSVPVAAVSNGVDLSKFRPHEVPEAMYNKYGLQKGAKTVLYVGRLDPEKNVGAVIEAYKKVSAKMQNTQLVIVGDGVDKVRLTNKARGMDDVHFLGRIVGGELYDIYQLGDIFVTASEIETQGIVLIEAGASGMPLVAVDAGAVAEVCRDGENGILCRPGDVEQMAIAIRKLLENDVLREQYAKKSLEIAGEHDFERTLDKFINIYNKVLDDKIE